jgi:hypothetical protein
MVRTTRSIAAIAALVLLLGACSDPQGTEPGDAAASSEPGGATAAPGGGGKNGPDGGGGKDGGAGKKGDGRGKDGASNGDSGDGGNGNGDGSGDPFGSSIEGGSGPDSLPYPSAGKYTYAQKGFEEFCQGASCDKQDLPATQTIDTSYAARSGATATVVTEARSSDRQTLTTTTQWGPDKAAVTKVVVDFSYSGFEFSQTYEPQPAVEAFLFPLKAGKRWSGRWDARTSGDYKARVIAAEDFEIDDKPTKVYKISTVTNFKGDFTGRAQTTVWLDARTRTIIKTDGKIAVASSFGEYTSTFQTIIQHGPNY